MWLLVAREPRPDAPEWPGRRLLAAVDAIAWPLMWVLLMRYAPQPVGLIGPFVTALAVLLGLGRLHRALWVNHRYWFTTWLCGKVAAAMLLIGAVFKGTRAAERVSFVSALHAATASVRYRRAAGAPSVEVDSTPSDSTLRETHRRRELVLCHQAIDRRPAESGHAHDRSHADEHGGLHIGYRRFRLGLRLAHQAAPGLHLRRTLGAPLALAGDDFRLKSVDRQAAGQLA